METTAAIVAGDGTVENIIVIDDEAEYAPPDDRTLVAIPDGQRAVLEGRWDGSQFIDPPEDALSDDDARLEELRAKADTGQLTVDDIADAVRLALNSRKI